MGALGHLNGLQGVQGFNRYAYVNNNPYKYTDPNGEFAWLVGAAVGAVLDVAVQAVAISTGAQESFSVRSLVASTFTGAVGGGIAANVAKLGLSAKTALAANVSTDALASVAGTTFSGGEVTAEGVLLDVALGQTAGKAFGDAAANAANSSNSQKVLNNVADRAERLANRPNARSSRVNNAANTRAAANNLPAEASAAAGTAASNAASKTYNCATGETC